MKRTIGGSIISSPWWLVLLVGVATGGLMAGLGVGMRLGNAIPGGPLATWFAVPFFAALRLTAGQIGWMLVLEGSFLIAAMCAIAVGNHWGWWSTAAAGLIAVFFFPGGTLAGVIVLAGLAAKLIREKPWKKPAKTGAEI